MAVRRSKNPTRPRLEWIAKTYPPAILVDVIVAFGEATGLHGFHRYWRYHDQQEAAHEIMGELDARMRRSTSPDLLAGATRYDRYLPWVAQTLNKRRKHTLRAPLKALRECIQHYERGTLVQTSYPLPTVLDALRAVESGSFTNEDLYVAHTYCPGPKLGDALDAYSRARETLVQNFRTITFWAEDEDIDLGEYGIDEAVVQSEEWAHCKAEEESENCDPMPFSLTVYAWPDGWTVRELHTKAELVCEGERMHHCVGDYDEVALAGGGGDKHIFSLRDPDNRPVVTMEFDGQAHVVPRSGFRAFANAMPDVAQTSRMLEFRLACPIFDDKWQETNEMKAPQGQGKKSDIAGRLAWLEPESIATETDPWVARYRRPPQYVGRGRHRQKVDDEGVVDIYGATPISPSNVARELREVLAQVEEETAEHAYEAAAQMLWPKRNRREIEREAKEIVARALDQATSGFAVLELVEEAELGSGGSGDLAWAAFVNGDRVELEDQEFDELIEAIEHHRGEGVEFAGIRPRSAPVVSLPPGEVWRQAFRQGPWHAYTLHPRGALSGECLPPSERKRAAGST